MPRHCACCSDGPCWHHDPRRYLDEQSESASSGADVPSSVDPLGPESDER